MSDGPLRVAWFADTFYEVNGAALASRKLEAFARERGYPLFSAHAGPETKIVTEGSVVRCELKRSPLSVSLEGDLEADPLVLWHRRRVFEALADFKPDILHFTGPNDISLIGTLAARKLRIPTTASWHTNVNEFAAWRLEKTFRFLPEPWVRGASQFVDRKILAILARLYATAKACFAPNPELVALLEERTGRPAFLMERGIDANVFSPDWRCRTDDTLEIGFIGRVSAEKNVMLLIDIEHALEAAGVSGFRIVVVGTGGELARLQKELRHAVFPGVLKGKELSRAYANLDLFVFPSHTDAYGNVVNEALASGTPLVVTATGGPKYIVTPGVTGFIAENDRHFVEIVVNLARDRERLFMMCATARAQAKRRSWDAVFENLYERYREVLAREREAVAAAPV